MIPHKQSKQYGVLSTHYHENYAPLEAETSESSAAFRLSIVALPADALNSYTDTASWWKQRRYRMRYDDDDDDDDGYEDHDDGGGALRARSAALDVSYGAL